MRQEQANSYKQCRAILNLWQVPRAGRSCSQASKCVCVCVGGATTWQMRGTYLAVITFSQSEDAEERQNIDPYSADAQ